MNLQSLGYKSELIFTSFDGSVEDRGTYLVVKTLTNPNYFWGNLLIFERPPQKGDLQEWIQIFKSEFPDPRIYHITLAWDSSDVSIGDVSEFLEAKFELEDKAVLTTRSVKPPPKFNSHLEIRTLQTQQEWDEMIKVQVLAAHDHLPKEEWEKFYKSQSIRYRKMSESGLGNWFGGFLDGRLVSGLGIFHRDGIGRFQTVCTDPQFQRQGLCGTLVYRASQHALSEYKLSQLVMCADPGYHAIKIYESVGFEQQQLEHGVYWWDRNWQSTSIGESQS